MSVTVEKEKVPRTGISLVLCVITWLLIAFTLYAVFFHAPVDRETGAIYRIFYLQTTSGGVAFVAFFLVMLFSAIYLVTTHQKWDDYAYASAEIGSVFCLMVLIIGPLWAQSVAHVWWIWDWRTIATLAIWLVCALYLIARTSLPRQYASRVAAVIGIFAFFVILLSYLLLHWWQIQHTLPFHIKDSALPFTPDMAFPLGVSLLGFLSLFGYLWQHRIALEAMGDDLENIRRVIVEQEQRMRDFLVENQDFIIEGYTFKEYKKDE